MKKRDKMLAAVIYSKPEWNNNKNPAKRRRKGTIN
jgi:hypothetical protein